MIDVGSACFLRLTSSVMSLFDVYVLHRAAFSVLWHVAGCDPHLPVRICQEMVVYT